MKCSFEAYEGKEKYIFISYAHKDSKKVMPIVEALHSKGYRVWYDDGIHPGDEWREMIAKRLVGSSLVLGFFSQSSLESQNCKNEINFAMSRKIDLICIHLEQVEMSIGLEMELSSYQALFHYVYSSMGEFFNKLEKAEKLKCCLGEVEKEVVETKPVVDNVSSIVSNTGEKTEEIKCTLGKAKKEVINSTPNYDNLSPQEQIDLYNKLNGKIFDFYIDEKNHVRISKYYDSPQRTSIQIPLFVYGFKIFYSFKELENSQGVFSQAFHLKSIAIHPQLQDLSFMFFKSNIKKLDLSIWDVCNVSNMSYMFLDTKLTSIGNVNFWNVSNVTDMSFMFNNSNITSIDSLDNWNVSNVTNMSHMFLNSQLASVGNLSNWNVSKVNDMSNMFSYTKFSSLGKLNNWNVSNVTNMSYMFDHSQLHFIGKINNWDVSNVKNIVGMFNFSKITSVGKLGSWNVSKVTDMSYLFNSSQFDSVGSLDNWNVSNITGSWNMRGMFNNTKLPRPKWYK